MASSGGVAGKESQSEAVELRNIGILERQRPSNAQTGRCRSGAGSHSAFHAIQQGSRPLDGRIKRV
jgi:hypothetical protein